MKRKNNYQSRKGFFSNKRSALNQGGRQSRREACGQKKRKKRAPRRPNREMQKNMKKYCLHTGSKHYETPLYNCTSHEKNYKMVLVFFRELAAGNQ